MTKTHLVIPDPHSKPGVNNDRAEWLGRLILDLRPDVVVCLGDAADMESLCTYDKGKKSFQGRTYSADIAAHADFQDRLWSTVRQGKRKMPRRVTLIGNHEERIARAIELQPELEGVISYDDLELGRYYNDIVPYEGSTPGCIEIDGVTYAHYLVSGISGRALSGEHPAYSLLSKKFASCVVGHSHLLDYSVRTRADGSKIMGLVAGCYQEHVPAYAGGSAELWWRGVCVLRSVESGCYDLQTIGLDRLKKEYGRAVRR